MANLAGGKTVRVDFDDQDLRILADGDWRGFRSQACEKEPETVDWLREISAGQKNPTANSAVGDVRTPEPITQRTDGPGREKLWDVGASVGSYSLIAAALDLEVVAFEPFAPSYGHLQQNIWLNGFDEHVTAVPFGVGTPMEKLTRLHVSNTAPGSASHGDTSFQHFQWMPVVSADEAAKTFAQPDHVKIDVDGAEMGVIENGRNVWPRVKSVMVESEPGTIENIEIILAAAGLRRVAAHRRLGDTRQHNYSFRRSEAGHS